MNNTKITELEQDVKALKEQIETINQNAFEIGKLAGEFTVKAQELENKLEEAKKEAAKQLEFKRADKGSTYYFINISLNGDTVRSLTDDYSFTDNTLFAKNNYFHTKARAQEAADKIKFLLKLERLHDVFCPNFVPDWDNQKQLKFHVFRVSETWCADVSYTSEFFEATYFPTKEIANKVCDILNKEEANINDT